MKKRFEIFGVKTKSDEIKLNFIGSVDRRRENYLLKSQGKFYTLIENKILPYQRKKDDFSMALEFQNPLDLELEVQKMRYEGNYNVVDGLDSLFEVIRPLREEERKVYSDNILDRIQNIPENITIALQKKKVAGETMDEGTYYESLNEIEDFLLGESLVFLSKKGKEKIIIESVKALFVDEMGEDFLKKNLKLIPRIGYILNIRRDYEYFLEQEKIKNSFIVDKINIDKKPRGGEDGQDGYLDITLTHIVSGEKLDVIYRDVFDFGVYGYPKRCNGTSECFHDSEWTEVERNAVHYIKMKYDINFDIRM